MTDAPKKETLEYVGPSGAVMFDADGKPVELIAGRRYQVEATLAQYRAKHEPRHWKRPDPPKVSAAVKEQTHGGITSE